MKRTEDALQRSVVEYLRLLENQGRLMFFAIPNGGKRSKIEAAIMKGLGVRAGVSDLVVLIPGRTSFDGQNCRWAKPPRAVFLELKSPTGKLSKEQVEFGCWLTAHGFKNWLVRSLSDVSELLHLEEVISADEWRII